MLLFSCLAGFLLGWFGIPWIIGWIKVKCSVKGTPGKNKRKSRNKKQK